MWQMSTVLEVRQTLAQAVQTPQAIPLTMPAKGELLRRLQALQTEPDTSLPILTHYYSLDELSNMKVGFGEKWKGSTFQQVWEKDQGYINCFLGKYGDSRKMEHCLFLTFIECMVDHAEDRRFPRRCRSSRHISFQPLPRAPKPRRRGSPRQRPSPRLQYVASPRRLSRR